MSHSSIYWVEKLHFKQHSFHRRMSKISAKHSCLCLCMLPSSPTEAEATEIELKTSRNQALWRVNWYSHCWCHWCPCHPGTSKLTPVLDGTTTAFQDSVILPPAKCLHSTTFLDGFPRSHAYVETIWHTCVMAMEDTGEQKCRWLWVWNVFAKAFKPWPGLSEEG